MVAVSGSPQPPRISDALAFSVADPDDIRGVTGRCNLSWTRNGSASGLPPSDSVARAKIALSQIQTALSTLALRGSVSVPDIAATICSATLRATTPSRPLPPRRGCADDRASVFEGSPFTKCKPGLWAAGRRPGDPHDGPQCTCGVYQRDDCGHFSVVDVTELYDMHCRYVCGAHEQDTAGNYIHSEAHESCTIHTLLTLLSGVWIPWRDSSAVPTTLLQARRIHTAPDSPEGQFVTQQLARGVEQDLWEKLSPEAAADFNQCSIIEAGFAALVGRLRLSATEAKVVNDEAPTVDVSAINMQAVQRAEAFLASLASCDSHQARVTKATFAQSWAAQGGGSKYRFCVAHNKFLNHCSHGWPLSFPTAYEVLETAEPSDVFITRDHKSGYSVIPIRPDQRRYFCFLDPVTGEVYRCKRLDFGWALSPGIFCAFTAELNAIICSRLVSDVDFRALSRYYVDDCITRVSRGGAKTVFHSQAGQRHCSANEVEAVAILDEVSRRANFPTSPEKVRWGTAVIYLGLHIDSTTRSAVVMPSKLFKALTMLHIVRLVVARGDIDVPVSFALKVAGNVQWLAQNFRLGRLYTPALWLAAEHLRTGQARRVTDCPRLLETCQWWAQAAAEGRLNPHRFVRALDIPSLSLSWSLATPGATVVTAVPLAHSRPGATRPVVAVLTDAAGREEGGAIAGCWRSPADVATHAFYATLSAEENNWRAICTKELLAQVTWLERFGHCYHGAVVLFGTDNAGNVFTVNRLHADTEDVVMTALLARLLAAADACDVECLVWWCPRALNGISDALSKCPTLADARRVATGLGVVLH